MLDADAGEAFVKSSAGICVTGDLVGTVSAGAAGESEGVAAVMVVLRPGSSKKNSLPQKPNTESLAATTTDVMLSGITTLDKDRVNGCSLTCGCSSTRVPNTTLVPFPAARTSHASAYLSQPVSSDDTVAVKVQVPDACCLAVAAITSAQPLSAKAKKGCRKNKKSNAFIVSDEVRVSFVSNIPACRL